MLISPFFFPCVGMLLDGSLMRWSKNLCRSLLSNFWFNFFQVEVFVLVCVFCEVAFLFCPFRFADAFNFLICFPKDTHIWCGSWDLMCPLLETFYNYFKDEHPDSPLKQLWKRISDEMRKCIQCISQHHQALEMYDREYELSCIIPLLDVLQTLDEERVTQHLREINARIAREEYDPACDNAEVVSIMYEVFFFYQ